MNVIQDEMARTGESALEVARRFDKLKSEHQAHLNAMKEQWNSLRKEIGDSKSWESVEGSITTFLKNLRTRFSDFDRAFQRGEWGKALWKLLVLLDTSPSAKEAGETKEDPSGPGGTYQTSKVSPEGRVYTQGPRRRRNGEHRVGDKLRPGSYLPGGTSPDRPLRY